MKKIKVIIILNILFWVASIWGEKYIPVDLTQFGTELRELKENSETFSDWTNIEVYDPLIYSKISKMEIKIELPLSDSIDSAILISSYGSFNVEVGDSLIYIYNEKEQSRLLHNISFPLDTEAIFIKYHFSGNYYDIPLLHVLGYSSKNADDVMDYNAKQVLLDVSEEILGFILIVFALLSFILAWWFPDGKKLLFGYSLFVFIEGLLIIINRINMSLMGIPYSFIFRIETSVTILHNCAVLLITNLFFMKGKSKLLKIVIGIQLLHLVIIQTTAEYYPLFINLNLLYSLGYLLSTGSIIYILIKNRKEIYPKLAFYLGFIYIALPLLAVLTSMNPLINKFFVVFYNVISVSILVIFVFILIVNYKRNQLNSLEKTLKLENKEKQMLILEKEKLRSQLSVLKNQISPHFLFNSLSTLTALIDLNQSKAIEYVEELSLVFRYVLLSGKRDLINLNEELEFLHSYEYLLAIRYSDNFKIDYQVQETYENKLIPPLTLQLLVENAVKHNIIDDDLPLKVTIRSENDFLIISNNLNHIDSSQTYMKPPKSTGIGQNNIIEMYKYYSDFEPKFLKSKTEYIVKIPLIN